MNVKDYATTLDEEIAFLTESGEVKTLEAIKTVYTELLKIVYRLMEFVENYDFININEEVEFFKNIKPRFASTLIYYQKLYQIKSHLPISMRSDIISYYLNELDNLKQYLEQNNELLAYYRSGSELFDNIYFVRKQPDFWMLLKDNCEPGNFTTFYDQKLSTLLAYEKLSVYLINEIYKLRSDSFPVDSTNQPSVTWTASKASLIELLYALQSSGACNNGTLEVKELANHFERLFNIKLGNFYRTFQEIRIRKISRTTFLDQLKQNLVKRMDDTDENPRY